MKKLNRFSILSGLVATISYNVAQTVPLYYTFEGDAESFCTSNCSGDDASAYHDITGNNLGDPVSYIFLVDDQVSSGVLPDGSRVDYGQSVEQEDGVDIRYSYDFYTELVSATGLKLDDSGQGTVDSGLFRGDFGYSPIPSSRYYEEPLFPEIYFDGYAPNGSINIHTSPLVPRSNIGSYDDLTNWLTDASIHTDDTVIHLLDNEGNNYRYRNDLTLVSVSTVLPSTSVPEPATYLLMSIGLMGIGAKRFKDYRS